MAAFRTLDDVGADVGGNAAIVRVDFNVPMENGRVTDDTRLRAALPTIRELQKRNAAIILLAHFGRPKGRVVPEMSLRPLLEPLSALIGSDVRFTDDLDHPYLTAENIKAREILLLENLRFKPGEEANDPEFARVLARCGDLYVNDAFSAAHRAHASTEALAHLLPAYAGLAMQRELEALEAALANPHRPLVAIVGGAKVSSKIDVLEHLVARADTLVIGGGMANTFLLAEGVAIGTSLAEPDLAGTARRVMIAAQDARHEILLPSDVVIAPELKAGIAADTVDVSAVPADRMILDVGPRTVALIEARIDEAATLVWNGPLGAFEVPPFDAATVAVARHAAKRTRVGRLRSVAGGGETVAALERAGVGDGLSFVSTAGGAFLEWLEGKALPGVEALRRAD